MKLFRYTYAVLMVLVPIALWIFGAVTNRLDSLNIAGLILCTVLGVVGSYLMRRMILEDIDYERRLREKHQSFQEMIEFYAYEHTN